MVGIGSHDKALPQQRGKVIAIEMDAAANGDGLAKDIDPAQKPDRPRLLVVIEKERLMRQPADQVVASAILYDPRFSHAKQYIIKSITMSMLLYQLALTLALAPLQTVSCHFSSATRLHSRRTRTSRLRKHRFSICLNRMSDIYSVASCAYQWLSSCPVGPIVLSRPVSNTKFA